MSDEKINIEVSKAFLENLFGIANIPVPESINEEELTKTTNKIKEKLETLTKLSQKTPNHSGDNNESSLSSSLADLDYNEDSTKKSVLIVDDLGVIVYQLEILFKKMGFNVVTSNEIHDTIAKFKKKDFGYVIMDLFIPTEKEGFLLLDELKKLILLCKLNTKIIVMTASSKSEFKISCKNKGANFYLEKTQGWQKELIEICKG